MIAANTAVELGLDMLGYADLSKGGGQATPSTKKLRDALMTYPEGRAEILLASLFLELENATSLDDVRKALPSYERLVDSTAAAM